MKKLLTLAMAVVLLVTLIPTIALAGNDGNGNGAPSGWHFNLNIIGVKDKAITKDSGNVMFVPLDTSGHTSRTGLAGKVDILLQPTYDGTFAVLDGNATDGTGIFAMPIDVATAYTVWIRGLGNPNGHADVTLAAYDPVAGEWLYALNTIYIDGHNVKIGPGGTPTTKFLNVSSDLFFLANGDAVFDTDYENWLWAYGNDGQKLVQLRFYPVVP